MAKLLLDSTGAEFFYLAYDLVAGEASDPVVIKVKLPARLDDQKLPRVSLLSESSASVRLLARPAGVGSYVDLAEGIDLTGYYVTPLGGPNHAGGAPIEFDLVCEADESVAGVIRVVLFLGVVSSNAAAWAA
jgi:hypothetical protein